MPIDDAMPVRLEAAGTETDAAEELLTALYGGTLHVATSAAPFSYRYAAIGDETMTLRTSRFGGKLAGELQPTDEVIVQWLQSGTSVLDTGGQPRQMILGVPMPLLSHRSFTFEMHDYEQRLVHLARPLVERVAAEQGADISAGIEFDHIVAPSEQYVRTSHNTMSLVAHSAGRLPRPAAPHGDGAAGRRIAAGDVPSCQPTMRRENTSVTNAV